MRGEQRLQQIMTIVGGFFMPLGLAIIAIGWYGTAHTGYVFEQIPYLVSGGLFGLGLTFTGALIFFSSWLARIVQLQRQHNELTRKLIDQLSTESAEDVSPGTSPGPRSSEPRSSGPRETIALPRGRHGMS